MLLLNLLFCALLSALFCNGLRAEDSKPELPKVTSEELTAAMAKNMTRVKEFEIIRAEAKKLGVRVYLFGGTAAAYAHYEKKQLQHERAGRQDQNARFDSDWFSIYRSTQDADLAVDGPREKIEQLKRILEEKLAHLKGSKPDWDLRSLREKTERQEALLKDPDFELQNSDSHSIGAIEITEPPEGKALVRDLRNWEGKRSLFLEDVRDGVLHFYRSNRHFESKRAAAGENPEIIGVIRYLIKRFQFELDVVPEEMAMVQKIIADFDPERDLANPKARNWVEKHAKKLVMHSSNAEYAFREMDRLGLRKKLLKLGGASDSGSLNWWLKKAALRGFKVGEGTGKTAREHQIDIISHSTRDMFVYESIIRSLDGIPNILESRNSEAGKKAGEVASYNTGHYTMRGEKGALGTGIDIRYHLDPDAREGTDFKILKNYDRQGRDRILVLNKFALRVIPESVNVDPVTYFKILAENKVDPSDEGLLALIRSRVHRDIGLVGDEEKRAIAKILEGASESKTLLFEQVVETGVLNSLRLSQETLLKMLFADDISFRSSREILFTYLRYTQKLTAEEGEIAVDSLGAHFSRALKSNLWKNRQCISELLYAVKGNLINGLTFDFDTYLRILAAPSADIGGWKISEHFFLQFKEAFLNKNSQSANLKRLSIWIREKINENGETAEAHRNYDLDFLLEKLLANGLFASIELATEDYFKLLIGWGLSASVSEVAVKEIHKRAKTITAVQKTKILKLLQASTSAFLESPDYDKSLFFKALAVAIELGLIQTPEDTLAPNAWGGTLRELLEVYFLNPVDVRLVNRPPSLFPAPELVKILNTYDGLSSDAQSWLMKLLPGQLTALRQQIDRKLAELNAAKVSAPPAPCTRVVEKLALTGRAPATSASGKR